jgi:hypothetical protein
MNHETQFSQLKVSNILFSKDEKHSTEKYEFTVFKRLRAVAGIWTTKQ